MRKKHLTYTTALFFLLVLLSIATPYLHNHEADFNEHDDCVAYLLATIFSLGIISVFFFAAIFGYQNAIVFLVSQKLISSVFSPQTSRAPPFSF